MKKTQEKRRPILERTYAAFMQFLGGSSAKECLVWGDTGVFGTLGKANKYFD